MTTPRRAPARRRRPATATKFQARPGTRRTTELKHAAGALTIPQTGNWVVVRTTLIQGTIGELSRIGGLKLTFRLKLPVNSQDIAAMCVGVLKTSALEADTWDAGDVIDRPDTIRRIFGKETWLDIGNWAPTLVQRSIRGMITLAQGQDLALVAMATSVAGAATNTLGWFAEWSERETKVD